jgi:hypothetical protein
MGNSITFTHKGQEYEVRWALIEDTYRIRAFKGDQPANGYEYRVAFPIALSMKTTRGICAIENLIEDAKRDVLEERWGKYVNLVKQLRAEEEALDKKIRSH